MRTFLTIILVIVFILPFSTHAFSIPGISNTPFGGRIIAVIPCPCNFRAMVIVGPPRGGTFIYIPVISKLHRFFALRPGVWSLGYATGRSACLVPTFFGCTPIGTGSIIREVGTSLF